mgnify:CR=1 FL=1
MRYREQHMYKEKRVTAIITAAGRGSRMGANTPKQFLTIGGRTVLERAIEPFESLAEIDEIIVVTGENYMDKCSSLCSRFAKVSKVVKGGSERQDSVKNALDVTEDGLVLIHDGARPYVTQETVKDVLSLAWETGAATAAVAAKDTIRQTCGKGQDAGSLTLDRSRLFNVQTPQGFDTRLIKKAFDKAYDEEYYGTDDAVLVERMGCKVALAKGSYGNIKITTKEDLPVEMRVGSGFDVHRLTEERDLILCGAKIPFEKGLLGHSDADVALHALMDAMLGAAAMGDIGKHFPDSDDKYKGISSMKLLAETTRLISEAGYTVGNADITIMAQRPKLLPYIPEMKNNVASALGVRAENINVKATTTEKLSLIHI